MEILSITAAKERAQNEITKQLRTGNLVPDRMQATDLNTFQEIGSFDAFEVLVLLDLLSGDFYPDAETVKYIGILDLGFDKILRQLTAAYATEIIQYLKQLPVDTK